MLRGLLFTLIFVATSAQAAVQIYSKEKIRELMFARMNEPIDFKIEILGVPPTAKHQAFLEYFTEVIVPGYEKMAIVGRQIRPLSLLLDSASYNSIEERDRWVAQLKNLRAQGNAFQTDPEWTAKLMKWAELAEGLTGPLADQARRTRTDRELEEFPESMTALLTEASSLMVEFSQAQNNAPATLQRKEIEKQLLETIEAYRAGKIKFADAQLAINRAVRTGGSRWVGMQAVKAAGQALNRVAVIRSQLAKTKGFNSWAEYQMELNDQGYTAEYRSPVRQRELLYKMLVALRPHAIAFFDNRMKELGVDPSTVWREHQGLLFKNGALLLRKNFPGDQISRIWEDNMKASGFNDDVLSQIVVDDQVRDGKNLNNAYLATVKVPAPEIEVIDAATLEPVVTIPRPDWERGLMYILQNYPNGGVGSLSTAFHEGGHALEHLTKDKLIDAPEGYGYVEIPSTTMEHFVDDAEVLAHYAVPVDGVTPTQDEIEKLLANDRESNLLELQGTAASALFDIELWDYDYSAPGAQSLTDRVKTLDTEINILTGAPAGIDTPAASHNRYFASQHFISGEVRYIGYVYAKIAASMMVEYTTQELVKTTGRSSWFNQPGLAGILIDRLYKEGWKLPFPTNIEAVTGLKFDPMLAVERLLPQTTCDAALTSP